jgi:hypothetical protein
MNRAEWDKAKTTRFWYYYQERHLSASEALRKAEAWAIQAIGPRPVDPRPVQVQDGISKTRVAVSLGTAILKGDVMEFSWLKAFGKGLLTVALAALSVGALQIVNAFFDAFQNTSQFEVMGVPGWAAAILLLVFKMAHNYLKFKLASLPKAE